MGEFELSNKIKMLNKYSNIDKLYGPYFIQTSAEDINPDSSKYETFSSLEELENELRPLAEVGLTIGVVDVDEEILEYWFLKDEEEIKLSPKGILLKLQGAEMYVDAELDSNGTNTVTISYIPIGNSIFASNAVTLYESNRIINIANFSEEGGSFVLHNIKNGTYNYKLIITDIFGNRVEKTLEKKIGNIEVSYNLLEITRLPLINRTNIEGKSFTVNINILNDEWEDASFNLVKLDNTQIPNVTLSKGQNTILIDSIMATNMEGAEIFLLAIATILGLVESLKYKLFEVVSSSKVFVEIDQTLPVFYNGVYRTVNFEFSSGASAVYMYDDGSSDFNFDSFTVNFNKYGKAKLSIIITPNREKETNSYIRFCYNDTFVEKSLGPILAEPEIYRDKLWDTTIPLEDTYLDPCYLDFTGIITPNFNPGENGEIIRFNDSMFITNEVIHVHGLEIATPLNEVVYVGMGYKLTDTNTNTGENVTYDCICINGTVVKISEKDVSYPSGTNRPLWTGEKTSDYIIFESDGQNICNGFVSSINLGLVGIDNVLMCETNYKLDMQASGLNVNLSDNMPLLYLVALDDLSNIEYKTWKSEFTNSSFGSISDGFTKYNTLGEAQTAASRNEFKILKEHTDIKSDVLKYYGVVCKFYFDQSGTKDTEHLEEISNKGIVTVYTLGTSTLKYAIPNFKFFFNDTFDLNVGTKVYHEDILTAKADYMESSHLNNTPTASLFNKIIKDTSIVTNEDKPSPPILFNREGNTDIYDDAITGTPIKLMIKDKNSPKFENYGSFMLNTDKVSDSLGFKVLDSLENEDEITCLSFEGTSNSVEGSAARFLSSEGNDQNLSISTLVEKDFELLTPVEKQTIIKYLARGFEYRYPDGEDIYKEADPIKNKPEKFMDSEHFELFYKMWKFVNTSTSSSNFEEVFNLKYCYIYIIFMMVFALTDNLGKNCMFDCWKNKEVDDPDNPGETILEWGKWYPRPYDLDSQCGLNNGGEEAIPPFVQINPDWLPEGVSIDESNLVDENTGENTTAGIWSYKYIKNKKIFGFASSDSKLWTNIYNKYKDNIEGLYGVLRSTGNYLDWNNLISHYENFIINKIPIALYNVDFKNKYLGTPLLEFMLGNRWSNFKDWLKARLAFCDAFFNYKKVTFYLNHDESIQIKYEFPSFVGTLYEGRSRYYFGKTIDNILIGPLGSGGNATNSVTLSDSIVTSMGLYGNSSFSGIESDIFEFTNLRTLLLGGNITPKLEKCKLLETLELTSTYYDSSNVSFIIPKSVKKFICRSNNISEISFEEGSLLEEFTIQNHSSLITLNFSNCLYLKKLTIIKSTISDLTISNNNIVSFVNTDNTYGNISISNSTLPDLELKNLNIYTINIDNSTINRIDFFNSHFDNLPTLNLKRVIGLNTLNLINSVGIEAVIVKSDFAISLQQLKLGFLDSDIKYFYSTNDSNEGEPLVDLTLLPSTVNIKSIVNDNSGLSNNPISPIVTLTYDTILNTYKIENRNIEYDGISFANTKITKVKLPSRTILGHALFANCKDLEQIIVSGSTACTLSSDWVFYNCPNLNSLPSNKIKINKFLGAYLGTKLAYSTIENTIDKNATNANFRYFLAKYLGNTTDITVDISKYPSDIKYMEYMFLQNHLGSSYHYATVREGRVINLTIKGEFTGTFSNISGTFAIRGGEIVFKSSSGQNSNTCFNSPDNITTASLAFYLSSIKFNLNEFLSSLVNLTDSSAMFMGCTIYNTDSINSLLCLNLTNANGMFYGTTFYDLNEQIPRIVADDIFKNVTSSILSANCCFYNCPLICIEGDLDISNITTLLNCVGMFGLSSPNLNDVGTKVIDFNDDSFPKFNQSESYSIGSNTWNVEQNSGIYCGTFSYRKCTNNDTIVLKDKSDLRHYCQGIYKENDRIGIRIENVLNINYICKDAGKARVGDTTIPTNGILIVNFSGCESAKEAFRNCKFVDFQEFDSTKFNLQNLEIATGMFLGSNINRIDFVLPSSILGVTYMFKDCMSLKNGLPGGFFEDAINITNITLMFWRTLIIRKLDTTDITRNISIPNQIKIAEGAFAISHYNSSNNEASYTIEFGDSNKLENIKGIFASSNIPFENINNLFINNNLDASFAFMNHYSFIDTNASGFPNDLDFSKIKTAIGMFYSELECNLVLDLANLSYLPSTTPVSGMLYNWTNPSILNKYKTMIGTDLPTDYMRGNASVNWP